jgi:hypothetical protein
MDDRINIGSQISPLEGYHSQRHQTSVIIHSTSCQIRNNINRRCNLNIKKHIVDQRRRHKIGRHRPVQIRRLVGVPSDLQWLSWQPTLLQSRADSMRQPRRWKIHKQDRCLVILHHYIITFIYYILNRHFILLFIIYRSLGCVLYELINLRKAFPPPVGQNSESPIVPTSDSSRFMPILNQ